MRESKIKENNKKETKIEHGKSCWERLLYITSHTAFYRPMPTRKTVIELAEGKIGFFGYRNHTKPVRRERAGHSVAFFFVVERKRCSLLLPYLPFSTFRNTTDV